jgi:hypothetical protein
MASKSYTPHPPHRFDCPACGTEVARDYRKAKLESDLVIRKGEEKITLPVTTLHCWNCGHIMLFSTTNLSEH